MVGAPNRRPVLMARARPDGRSETCWAEVPQTDLEPQKNGPAVPDRPRRWRQGDSNPRPLQCDCSALPTELCPLASRVSIEGSVEERQRILRLSAGTVINLGGG